MFCFDPTSLLQVDIDTDWAMVGTPFVGPDKGLVYTCGWRIRRNPTSFDLRVP